MNMFHQLKIRDYLVWKKKPTLNKDDSLAANIEFNEDIICTMG